MIRYPKVERAPASKISISRVINLPEKHECHKLRALAGSGVSLKLLMEP